MCVLIEELEVIIVFFNYSWRQILFILHFNRKLLKLADPFAFFNFEEFLLDCLHVAVIVAENYFEEVYFKVRHDRGL
jgi:hypothetical protein